MNINTQEEGVDGGGGGWAKAIMHGYFLQSTIDRSAFH